MLALQVPCFQNSLSREFGRSLDGTGRCMGLQDGALAALRGVGVSGQLHCSVGTYGLPFSLQRGAGLSLYYLKCALCPTPELSGRRQAQLARMR